MINHRAQVPGYCGYIPGKNSENRFGATFGIISKDSLKTQNQSFLTSNVQTTHLIQHQATKTNKSPQKQQGTSVIQTKLNNTQRIPCQKFVPKQQTTLTYQQATKTHY